MSIDSLKIIFDSLSYTRNHLLLQKDDIFSWSITFGDILTIIGFGLAIWQFRKQMKVSREANDVAQRETWFLNVIVLPQLNLIDKFYKRLIQSVVEQQGKIKDLYSSSVNTPEEFNVRVAHIKNECKEKINAFYDHIIVLVKSYDMSLGGKVSDEIMRLEDICTSLLDDFSTLNKEKIRRNILNNKQKIISLLNTGMRKI